MRLAWFTARHNPAGPDGNPVRADVGPDAGHDVYPDAESDGESDGEPDAGPGADPLDDLAPLVGQIAHRHQVDVITPDRAHDFVVQQDRQPFDVCIYELDDTAGDCFLWPYLFRYPGVVLLRGDSLNRSRRAALRRMSRLDDAARERAFGDWSLLRAPLLAATLVVAPDETRAAELRLRFPEVRCLTATTGVAASHLATRPGHVATRPGAGRTRFGLLGGSDPEVARRALERARQTAPQIDLVEGTPADVLAQADVLLALPWPNPPGPPVAALAAMAARRALIVFENGATATWPLLDPQTWQPRGYWPSAPPIAISISPLDEEHSLMLAIRRLAVDPQLRDTLAAAGYAWWRDHATPAHAAASWDPILEAAISAAPPPRPDNFPSHLTADGSERARAILSEFGVTTDLFG